MANEFFECEVFVLHRLDDFFKTGEGFFKSGLGRLTIGRV